jgi:hypothetical protein
LSDPHLIRIAAPIGMPDNRVQPSVRRPRFRAVSISPAEADTALKIPMSHQRGELPLVKQAVRFLMQYKPSACRTYEDLAEDPLFRGIVDGLDPRDGITDAEIQREVFQVLPQLRTAEQAVDDAEDSVAQHDAYMRLLHKFSPDETERLSARAQVKVWQMWVALQLGSLEWRTRDFDGTHARSMLAANARAARAEAARADGGRAEEAEW